MSKNFNKMKGAANVKLGSEDREAYESSEFSSAEADVIRDESRWDAFQLIGDSNGEEMTYVSQPKPEMSEKEMQKALDRAVAFRTARKIQMMLDAEAA